MPLIVLCGIPGSGKTRRALEVKEYLEAKHACKVILINEEFLQLQKKEAYKDAQAEKLTRGFLRSNVEKHLSANVVVILDSLNYIKGFRYELYCLARSQETQNCVIYCECKPEDAKEFNSRHLDNNNFSQEMLDDFNNRLEVPIQKNRWDSPLFHLRTNESTPCEQIAGVLLFQEKKSKDPVSTAPQLTMDTNWIQETDKRVQQIIDELIQKQQESIEGGGVLTLSETSEKLVLTRSLSLMELKRIKQEYLKICKHTPPKKLEDIKNFFVVYLNNVLQRN